MNLGRDTPRTRAQPIRASRGLLITAALILKRLRLCRALPLAVLLSRDSPAILFAIVKRCRYGTTSNSGSPR